MAVRADLRRSDIGHVSAPLRSGEWHAFAAVHGRRLSEARQAAKPRCYPWMTPNATHLSAFLTGINSHSLRVGSSSGESRIPITRLLPTEATFLPSGLKATAQTLPEGPFTVPAFLPFSTSQSLMPRTVPAATVLPSGLKATE